jgi:hypothetical protein
VKVTSLVPDAAFDNGLVLQPILLIGWEAKASIAKKELPTNLLKLLRGK